MVKAWVLIMPFRRVMASWCDTPRPFCRVAIAWSNGWCPGEATSVRRAWCCAARLSHSVVAIEVPNAPAVSRAKFDRPDAARSEEHTSELQSLMRIPYGGLRLKKKKTPHRIPPRNPDNQPEIRPKAAEQVCTMSLRPLYHSNSRSPGPNIYRI